MVDYESIAETFLSRRFVNGEKSRKAYEIRRDIYRIDKAIWRLRIIRWHSFDLLCVLMKIRDRTLTSHLV